MSRGRSYQGSSSVFLSPSKLSMILFTIEFSIQRNLNSLVSREIAKIAVINLTMQYVKMYIF